MAKTYLFTVNPATPPALTIDPGAEIEVTVDGAFDEIEDIAEVPTPFTPASEGHPLAPVTGPIAVRGARPGDSVAIDLLAIEALRRGRQRGAARLRRAQGRSSPSPPSSPARSATGRPGSQAGWRSRSRPISARSAPCRPRATAPPTPGPYGGDFDQRDVGAGARVHLPVLVDDALVFMADPHARDQRRHHQRHRRRVLGAGAGAHRAGEGEPGGAADLRAGRHGADRGLRPLGGGRDRGCLRRRGRPGRRLGPGSRGARPTCCSASSASSASALRPAPSWRRG